MKHAKLIELNSYLHWDQAYLVNYEEYENITNMNILPKLILVKYLNHTLLFTNRL